MSTPSPRQFDKTIEIAADRETVWKALTEGAEIQRWFAPQARVEPGVGGVVEWTWPELHDWPQVIEAWEPGERLGTRYVSNIDDGQGGKVPLFMDFLLEGEGGRTTLRLVHSGFGPEAKFDQEYDGISRGWSIELQSLRTYVERHAGVERQLVWATRDIGGSLQEAWERLTSNEGLASGPGLDALAEGAPFRIETVDGDVFEGTALQCNSTEFSGVAESHGGAFLRLAVEQCGPTRKAWLWMAGYDRPAAEIAGLQSRWDALLGRLFAEEPARAGEGSA